MEMSRCVDLEMEGKSSEMKRVARQEMLLQYIMDLANTSRQDPRSAIRPFFGRMADPRVRDDFNLAVDDFAKKIQGRAVEKRKEQEQEAKEKVKSGRDEAVDDEEEYQELSREERLGPGGLDPVEVFEELPKELQDCFEKADIPMLK